MARMIGGDTRQGSGGAPRVPAWLAGARGHSPLPLGDAHGPAAFERLYAKRGAAPRAVAVIQPGKGWGGNWTDFRRSDGPLARAVMGHPAGAPTWLLVDHEGRGAEAEPPVWDGFPTLLRVDEFRSVYGAAGRRQLAVWGMARGGGAKP